MISDVTLILIKFIAPPMTTALNQIRPRNTIKVIISLLLFSSSAISQKTAANVSDTMVSNLLSKLTDHDKIDRDIAIKYLHLDSIELQENPAIQSDSSFSFGPDVFWIVSYAAVVNCEYKVLIEYKKESGVFYNWLLIETNCDFDPSGDHTTQTAFKIKGNMLYVYKNYYRIRNEDLVLNKKHSTYCAYRFPDLKAVFIGKPLP
jgi:hypothetical protein